MEELDEKKKHWEDIYSTKTADKLSWTEESPSPSKEWIIETTPERSAGIIDVGAGISPLTKCLLAEGYKKLAVLDISSKALARSQKQLEEQHTCVEWIEADVTSFTSERKFSLWHDRAVFHFLTSPDLRKKYVDAVQRNLLPGGHLIIATFSLSGPKKCSGLDVMQFDAKRLKAEVGDRFELVRSLEKKHTTPWGANQDFIYCLFRSI